MKRSPPRTSATKERAKRRFFSQFTHDQISYPMGRGTSAGLVPLAPEEKLLLMAMDNEAWKYNGICKMTNWELANAIGLTGEPAKVKRKVLMMINGRSSRGGFIPGLRQKGFIKVHPDPDPRNLSQRQIERTAKWMEYQKVRLAQTDHDTGIETPEGHPECSVQTHGGGYTRRAGGGTHGAQGGVHTARTPQSRRLFRPEDEKSSSLGIAATDNDDSFRACSPEEVNALVEQARELIGENTPGEPWFRDLIATYTLPWVKAALRRAAERRAAGAKIRPGYLVNTLKGFAKQGAPSPELLRPPPRLLSDDAKQVHSIRKGNPHLPLHSHFVQTLGWSPERFDRAVAELKRESPS